MSIIYGDSTKIYFYTTETNINNYKSLKIDLNSYLKEFGDYEFQPFNNKDIFEKHLDDENSIFIISSWHYKKLASTYNLKAVLIAQKGNSIKDKNLLISNYYSKSSNILASAFDKEYTKEILQNYKQKNSLNILRVPKELDAIISLSLGMVDYAIVSRDSLEYIKTKNPVIVKKIKIVNDNHENYRMVVCKKYIKKHEKIINILKNMHKNKKGNKQLKFFGIDRFTLLSNKELNILEGKR